MDNDSTTIARILVNRRTLHKVLKKLKVRSHIERCFTYCVKQAKGCADQLSSNLLKMKIVTHLYGKNKISSNKH